MKITRDIEDAYFCTLYSCLSGVSDAYLQKVQEGSFIGKYRLQLPGMAMKINHPPGQRPLVPTPEGKDHLAVCTDKYIEEEYINYLLGNKKADNEIYTYGERINETLWYNDNGTWRHTTQLAWCIHKLVQTRNTNQATLAVERPSDIILKDPPCLRTISFKVVNGKLNMSIFFRSWDAYAGLPVNLAGLQVFKEAIATMTALKTGVTYAYSDGCHIYEQDWPVACERVGFKYDKWLEGAEEHFKIKLTK